VPSGVTQIKVLCVGGGGGGTNGHQAGGGSGRVNSGVFSVSPGAGYQVTVGSPGMGAATDTANIIINNLLSATGGDTQSIVNGPGSNGGSGGGGSCNGGAPGGAGGINGGNGGACSYAGGVGQGSFGTHFGTFIGSNTFTAGQGGAGGQSVGSAGGGGGGVLVNGIGPLAQNGSAPFIGKGGQGYGGGGGGGGYDGGNRFGGGNGAPGLVYFEW